jgi:predicted DsbA family dithiol-disulfide isomerase
MESFQLDAGFVASPEDNLVAHLAEKYRKDTDWAQGMLDDMTQNAKIRLDFHLKKAIMANSLHAHRLLHWLKYYLANDLLLFKAFGWKNINDLDTLKVLGLERTSESIDEVLQSNVYK